MTIGSAANSDTVKAVVGKFTDAAGNAYVPVTYTYHSAGTVWQ